MTAGRVWDPRAPVESRPGVVDPFGLRCELGSEPGLSLNLKARLTHGRFSRVPPIVEWERAAVRLVQRQADGSKTIDAWELEPAAHPEAELQLIEAGSRYVCGRFVRVAHLTGKRANEWWRDFVAE